MPSKSAMPTREELLAEVDAASTRAAELQQQMFEQDQAAHQRKLAAQREWDEQLVAGYNRAAIDAEAEQAKAAFEQALADDPLVLALAAWAAAMRRRSHRLYEHMAALGRLGLPTAPPDLVVTDLSALDEYVIRTAERLAGDRIAAENADLHARRDAAGDNPKETS